MSFPTSDHHFDRFVSRSYYSPGCLFTINEETHLGFMMFQMSVSVSYEHEHDRVPLFVFTFYGCSDASEPVMLSGFPSVCYHQVRDVAFMRRGSISVPCGKNVS